MTTELYILTLAALLQVVQFVLYSITANMQVKPGTALGPRDKPVHLTGAAGRLQRAMSNHFEGLILFTIAVVIVTLADQSSPVTRGAAHVYLVARILYVPAYVQGLMPWRSVIWFVGFLATVTMLVAALI
ncbi:MAG: MAPEG family protein [Pseudomonadota bacterium]